MFSDQSRKSNPRPLRGKTPGVDLDLAPADDPRRVEIRAWLAEHAEPTRPELAAAGFVAPHWPAPWGLDADPELQLIIDQELTDAGVVLPDASIAIGWAGPTIIEGGTVQQQQRWIPGILDGSAEWCQLFSEPDAGSDLASLRTSAVRDGDHYVVTGQKIWSTWANRSDWGILLARTDLDAAKHRGHLVLLPRHDLAGHRGPRDRRDDRAATTSTRRGSTRCAFRSTAESATRVTGGGSPG